MKKTILALLAASGLVLSCTRALYMPASPDAAKQQLLLTGRGLYVVHCGSCHNLHLPAEYDSAGWVKQLNEMKARAKITDDEKQLMLKYLTEKH